MILQNVFDYHYYLFWFPLAGHYLHILLQIAEHILEICSKVQ